MKLLLGLNEANGDQEDLSTSYFSAVLSKAWSKMAFQQRPNKVGQALGCLLPFLEHCICQSCRSSLMGWCLVVRGTAGTCDLALPSTQAS